MPDYRRQSLDGLGHAVSPPVEPLNGLQVMRRGPVEALFRAQDHVTALSRRIIACGGLRGSTTWSTPDTDPTTRGTPLASTRRIIGMGMADLTPGCFLRCWVVAVPSGACSDGVETSPGVWGDAGAQGSIAIDCEWTDRSAVTVSTSHVQALPASEETYGAEPSPMFANLHTFDIEITPPGLGATDELRRWCQHGTVAVTIYAVGGARIVDAQVFEFPYDIAKEVGDDADTWCSHMYGAGSPSGPAQLLGFPYEAFSSTDERGGTLHVMDVHHAQQQRLGPMLFSWSAALESTGAESVTTASASLVALDGGGSTTFDLTEPGLACGTGGYARRLSSNSAYVLRGRVAAVPVFVRVYASTGTTGSVRVQTRRDSYIDVAITGAAGWYTEYGWLEVGITPDDTSALLVQLWHTVSTVYAVSVYYAGGYTPAA